MKLARKRMRVCAKWVVKSAIFKIESHPASREEPWIEPFFICLKAWLERKTERLWSLNSYMKAWNVKKSDERFSLEKRKRLSRDRFPSEIESYTTHIALQWIDWNPNMNVHFWVWPKSLNWQNGSTAAIRYNPYFLHSATIFNDFRVHFTISLNCVLQFTIVFNQLFHPVLG